MLLYFAQDGTLSVYTGEAINQGSVKANQIEILGKFTGGVMTLGFVLPNGQRTTPVATTPTTGAEGYSLWVYTMNATLLSLAGELKIQAFYTINDETLSSTMATVTINRGTASYTPTPSSADWNALLQIYGRCRDFAVISEGFAVGQKDGADVPSTSPYYHNNAKYYAEVAEDKSGDAAGYAQQAAQSAQSAAQSAQTATTKAGEASQSAQTATTKAGEAAQSATDASGYADDAEGYADDASDSATAAAGYLDQITGIAATKQDKKPDGTNNLIDANGKVAMRYIPEGIIGQVSFQGTWNASTGVPSETFPTTVQKGMYWMCATAGGNKLPNGQTSAFTFDVGDWAMITVVSPLTWAKIDNTDAVTSVNGQIGATIAKASGIGAPTDITYDTTNGLTITAPFKTRNGAGNDDTFEGTYQIPIIAGQGISMDETATTNKLEIKIDTTVVATVDDIAELEESKQDTIDSSHKLSADLVDDTSSTNKFVTATQKSILASAITNSGIGYSEGTTITWDGDTTGKTINQLDEDTLYCKVSNDTLSSADAYIGSNMSAFVDGSIVNDVVDASYEMATDIYALEGSQFDVLPLVVLNDATITHEGTTYTFTKGIWFNKWMNTYTSSLTYGSTHKISSDMVDDTNHTNKFVPTVATADKDKYLHTNASTGALEWTEVESGTEWFEAIYQNTSTLYAQIDAAVTAGKKLYFSNPVFGEKMAAHYTKTTVDGYGQYNFYTTQNNNSAVYICNENTGWGLGDVEKFGLQYETLPATASNDTIVQYIGSNTSTLKKGYFYRCYNNVWTQVEVAENLQFSSIAGWIPVEGMIRQYIGTTNGMFTNGYFYKYTDGAWEQLNVQPAGGYTAGDGISINNNEISVKVGEGLFFDDSDQVCLNNATQQTLNAVSGKEGKGKVTIGETEYTVAISTTDAGTAGYITFVVEA